MEPSKSEHQKLSPIQFQVVEILSEISKGNQFKLQEWYLGSLATLNREGPDYLSQAANSIREIADKLPELIGIKFESPVSPSKNAMAVISKSLEKYSVELVNQTIDKPLANGLQLLHKANKLKQATARTKLFQKSLETKDPLSDRYGDLYAKQRDEAFSDCHQYFQTITHHRKLTTKDEFIAKLSIFESMLIAYYAPQTAEQHEEIDQIITAAPTEKSKHRLAELFPHNSANLSYFFKSLSNPGWIDFMQEQGHFDKIPDSQKNEDGSISHPHHEPLYTLINLASIDPEKVVHVLQSIKIPENPSALGQILNCCAVLNSVPSIKQVIKIVKPIIRKHSSTYAMKHLCEQWIKVGATNEILLLIPAYLSRIIEVNKRNSESDWELKEIERSILIPLIASHPFDLGKILFHQLKYWGERKMNKTNDGDTNQKLKESTASYWLNDCANPIDQFRFVETLLVKLTILSGRAIYACADVKQIEIFDQRLKNVEWDVFDRIRWQLYSEFPNLSQEQARADILKLIPFLNRIQNTHPVERARMLHNHTKEFDSTFLTPEEVVAFTYLVNNGPINHAGETITEERIIQNFRNKQLAPIRQLLTEKLTTKLFDKASAKNSDLNELDYVKSPRNTEARNIKNVPPVDKDAISSMSNEEIWHTANTIQATGHGKNNNWHHEESLDELGKILAEIIRENPDRFRNEDKWWRNITRAEILSAVLSAEKAHYFTADVTTENSEIAAQEWSRWLDLAEWVIAQSIPAQTQENVANDSKQQMENPWYWTNQKLLDLLHPLIHVEEISDNDQSKINQLLLTILAAPDQRLDNTKIEYDEDWKYEAINSVRGETAQIILNSTLKLKNRGKPPEEYKPFIDVLFERIQDTNESLALVAELASHLRFIHYLAPDKTVALLEAFKSSSMETKRHVFVESFLEYGTLHVEMAPIIPTIVEMAINMLPSSSNDESHNFATQLGFLIIWFDWNNTLPDKQGSTLMEKFLSKASPQQRAQTLSEIIHGLNNNSEALDQDLHSKAKIFFAQRLLAIRKRVERNANHIEIEPELSALLGILNCTQLDEDWSIDFILEALRLTSKPLNVSLPTMALRELIQRSTQRVKIFDIITLLAMQTPPSSNWNFHNKELEKFVFDGLVAKEETEQKAAKRAQDALLKLGLSNYKKP